MSKAQRVKEILLGLLSIAGAAIMSLNPDFGYALVVLILCISLVLCGIEKIGYYFTMGRYMVGGRSVLYLGILLLDVGILAGSLSSTPQAFVMAYLLAGHMLDGVVLIMRAREQHGFDAPWRLTLAQGIANILIGLTCIVFVRSIRLAVYVYCVGLVYSSCLRIASAFRRTSIVYIP